MLRVTPSSRQRKRIIVLDRENLLATDPTARGVSQEERVDATNLGAGLQPPALHPPPRLLVGEKRTVLLPSPLGRVPNPGVHVVESFDGTGRRTGIEQVIRGPWLYPLLVVVLTTMALVAQGLPILDGALATAVSGHNVVRFEVLRSSALAALVPVRFEYRLLNTPWETV